MVQRSPIARLTDMLEAIARIRESLANKNLDEFETDWRARWLVERGVEIVSEASRHLPDAVKARHPHIPWRKVAGIGNILRHGYEHVAPDILWKLAQADLAELHDACRSELSRIDEPGDSH